MFDFEINGLKSLIQKATSYCSRCGFDNQRTSSFIEEKSKRFFDVIVAIAAVNKILYDRMVSEMPTLKGYLDDKIQNYLEQVPSDSYFEQELLKFIEKTKDIEGITNPFLKDNVCIVFLYDKIKKYGFAQGLAVAVSKIKPEWMQYLTYKYSSAIMAAQHIDEDRNIEDR